MKLTLQQFIAKYLPIATEELAGSGISPIVAIAQAWIETGGNSTPKNGNFYGIKTWKGSGVPSANFATTEYFDGVKTSIVDSFEVHKDFRESVRQYEKFLRGNPRYKKAIAKTGWLEQGQAIAAAGYATGPAYANLIASVGRSVVRHAQTLNIALGIALVFSVSALWLLN